MRRSGEQVHRFYVGGDIPQRGEALDISGQGRRVAGDVDDTPGLHSSGRLDRRLIQPLPGRVHNDHIWRGTALCQLLRGLPGVSAQKCDIFQAIAGRVLLRVLHRFGDHLHTNGTPGTAGHNAGDGPSAAIEVQYRLRLVQRGELQRLFIEALRLVMIDLVEGAGRDSKLQAAQRILQCVCAPDCPKFPA